MDIFKKYYQDRSVLVTGGAGFIGSHIVDALVAFGANVTVLDDFSTGSLDNLQSVEQNITIVEGDIRNRELVQSSVQKADYIFHCAALVSVYQSIENPNLSHDVNYQGTKNIIDALIPEKKQRLVLSSTSAVYGNREDKCYESSLTDPLSPYAQDKLLAESLVQKAVIDHRLSVGVVLRYFNVSGERQNPHGSYASVVPRFKKSLLDGDSITIFGDGYQVRDFISVDDVVEANVITAVSTQEDFLLCNIATGESISLHRLLFNLENEFSKKFVNIIFEPERAGEVRYSRASVGKWKSVQKEFYNSKESNIFLPTQEKKILSEKDM